MTVIERLHKHAINKSGLVFAGAKGSAMTHVKRSWAGLVTAAKLDDFHFHDLRHHFASRLVMAGVDLYAVKELLGHTDFAMTQRYAHSMMSTRPRRSKSSSLQDESKAIQGNASAGSHRKYQSERFRGGGIGLAYRIDRAVAPI